MNLEAERNAQKLGLRATMGRSYGDALAFAEAKKKAEE